MADKPKGPGGRPSKYQDDFPELLLEHFQTGKSFETFAAKLYRERNLLVCRDTLYEWARVHPEFSYAKSAGALLSQDHWEEILATNVHTPPGQWSQTACMFILKCRFGYRDTSLDDDSKKHIDDQNEKLANVSKQLEQLIDKK